MSYERDKTRGSINPSSPSDSEPAKQLSFDKKEQNHESSSKRNESSTDIKRNDGGSQVEPPVVVTSKKMKIAQTSLFGQATASIEQQQRQNRMYQSQQDDTDKTITK